MRIQLRKPLAAAVGALLAAVLISRGATADEHNAPLQKLTEEMSRELVRVREKALKRLPPVERVTRERFVEDYAIKNFRFMWGDRYEDAMSVFKALGLIPREIDAEQFIRKYGAIMAAAAYDILEGRVLFPQTRVRRDVLLHELTHALTDQHYDIKKLMRSTGGNFDRILAMGALIEGEATLVQARYSMAGQKLAFSLAPYDPLQAFVRRYSEDLLRAWEKHVPDIPENVLRSQKFVYDEGILFVEKLRRSRRGWDAVDMAYRNPPRSTTQIIHPRKYLAGEWPVELDVRDKETRLPGYKLLTENTLGEFGIGLFLRTHKPKRDVRATSAAGWRGDRVFLYRNVKGLEALVWVSSWESHERAREMFGPLIERVKPFADRYPPFQGEHGIGPSFFAKVKDREIVILVGSGGVGGRFDHLQKDGIIRREPERKPPLGQTQVPSQKK